MDLKELQQHWNQFGSDDPLWAILTVDSKKRGRWDVGEFFALGRDEISVMLSIAERVVGRQLRGGRAMDFGCGVGRLTQGLCDHFDRADGVDIAASMIEGARRFNAHGDRCHYHHNTGPDLSLFGDATFDFVYTSQVLQHMEPRYAKGFVQEFVRVLKPGGVLLFEITTDAVVGATEPLPEDAFRATLRPKNPVRELLADSKPVVAVEIRNDSPHPWPASGKEGWYAVTVGNHWRDEGDNRVVVDDARVRLERDIAPGESFVAELVVAVAPAPGQYVLEVDLCQEGVTWFEGKGSSVLRIPVRVTKGRLFGRRSGKSAAGGGKDGAEAAVQPRMEMYGTPEPEVRRWVEDVRGKVLDVFDYEAAMGRGTPPDWYRRGFVVTK